MKTEQKYLALDLEMNSDGKRTYEVIQVGISVGDIQNGITFTDQKMVRFLYTPNGESSLEALTDFIQNLTKITQSEYDKNVISSKECAEWISNIIEEFNPFRSPITWGGGDCHSLLKSFRQENINIPYFQNRFIDVKTLYSYIEIVNGRSGSGSLNSALKRYKLKFEGVKHRADDDAKNTLKLFFHLLKRQNKIENTIDMFKNEF